MIDPGREFRFNLKPNDLAFALKARKLDLECKGCGMTGEVWSNLGWIIINALDQWKERHSLCGK